MALGRASREGRERRLPDRRVLGALVAASILFNASLSVGGIGHSVWQWRHRDAADQARRAAVRMVPSSAPVSATSRVWRLVAGRSAFYGFPNPFLEYTPRKDPVPVAVRRQQTNWLVIDTSDPTQWNDEAAHKLDRVVAENGFTMVFERAGIVVFRRGP